MAFDFVERRLVRNGNSVTWSVAWLETMLFTVAAGLAALWLHPEDPLFVRSEFPWLLLMPVLLALRYGAIAGTVSITLFVTVWLAGTQHGMMDGEFPGNYFIGGEMLVLVCGQFSSLWSVRLRRLERVGQFNEERLNQLTRRHYLLRLSHDQLEQSLISAPVTLRSALTEIRGLVATEQGRLPGAARFLALVARVCQIEVASLHPVTAARPESGHFACIGEPGTFHADDPLLADCLDRRVLVHVRDQGDDAPHTEYLVAAPLIDGEDHLLAVMLVEKIPFHCFHDENLRTLSVLLAYYADSLRRINSALVIQDVLPGCPLTFAEEVLRAHRLRAETGVASSLIAFRFDQHPDRDSFVAAVTGGVRDLDCVWRARMDPDPVLMILLPLAGRAGAEGYLMRADSMLRNRYQVGFDAAGISTYLVDLTDERPVVTMTVLLDYCGARS
jgi:hypothetical protein